MLVAAGIPVQAAESGRGNLLFDLDSGDVWLERRGPSPVRAGRAPSEVLEVYLHPGEWYFGDAGTRIKTLLGSCVAFTLWHPARLTGGMCHYMLPTRGTPRGVQAMDGRYGDEALALLVEQIVATGSRPSDFVAKMFGGGAMFETGDNGVAADNVAAARSLLALHGFDAGGDCLGGAGHRNVVFDVWSGETWLRRGGLQGRRAA
ncbi:MAG: chemotaxis protein CheD [Betaproteobacteria bacterium]|nr:chemotaxis protein CheD [Betaproteobacteria bacterium]